MIFYFYKVFIMLVVLLFSSQQSAFSIQYYKKYEAVVEGKITNKKVKKINNYYITEYKLKPKKWIYKKPEVKKTNSLTIRILGAELPEKGIVIKSSVAPYYVPINKEATFLLEKTKSKQKNVFTLTNNGIIFKES